MIRVETAQVFRTSHGRRYLTKRAAFKAEAMFRMKQRYDKEGASNREDGSEDTFYTDDQWGHFGRVVARYWRMFGCKRMKASV